MFFTYLGKAIAVIAILIGGLTAAVSAPDFFRGFDGVNMPNKYIAKSLEIGITMFVVGVVIGTLSEISISLRNKL